MAHDELQENINYWPSPITPTSNPNFQIYLTTQKLSPQPLLDFVKTPKAGAVIYFGGTTRDNFGNKTVTSLSYEAHTKLALRTLNKIATEAINKFTDDEDLISEQATTVKKIHKIAIVHRLGVVPVMEESIMVVVSSSHRQEGWECGEWCLEKIKELCEIWKVEHYGGEGDESVWKVNENSGVVL